MHVFMYVCELGQRNTHLQSPDASNSYRMMGFFGRGYFAISGGENAWMHSRWWMNAFEGWKMLPGNTDNPLPRLMVTAFFGVGATKFA